MADTLVDDYDVIDLMGRLTTHCVELIGFQSAYAVPVRLRAQTIGALYLFGARPDAPATTDLRLAQALADVATIGILQKRAIRHHDMLAEQLQSAGTSRVIIEQAKGVLVEPVGLDMPDAFAALRSRAGERIDG